MVGMWGVPPVPMAITCIQITLANQAVTNTSSRMNGIIVVIRVMLIVEIARVCTQLPASIVDLLTFSLKIPQEDIVWVNVQPKGTLWVEIPALNAIKPVYSVVEPLLPIVFPVELVFIYRIVSVVMCVALVRTQTTQI